MEQEALLLTSAAVVSQTCAKLGCAIGDGAAVMVVVPNLRDHLVDMKTTLEAIGAPLEGAQMPTWSFRDEEVQVERWLKRVKEAAYDIWDMLDDLQANNNTTPPAANTIRTGMLTRLANKIGNRTNKIRDNLRVILQESSSFSSGNWSSYDKEGLLCSRPETPPLHIITGRDEDKQMIVLAVLSAADDMREGKGPIILPIFGFTGVGKTTLAKLVSDDTRFKDYTKVWVSLPYKFDSLKLGRCIISQLSGAESEDSNGIEFIMRRLNELLAGKKVLVILDGLWEDRGSVLERLRHMFSPLSDKGSKVIVIVTTRFHSIAERICTLGPYGLDPLSDDMCWTIIKQKSSFEARDDKQELEQIGRNIAKMLWGSPLAAQAVGYMLRSKDPRAWSMLSNDSIWNDRREYHEPVYSALVLCCQDLPPNLRLCFAYCAIIPRGHGIARDELIHQWIALDFIEPSDRSSTTQLAEEYITTLLGMSLLEPTKSASTSRKGAMLLTMHELVHYFARLLFRDELFVVDHIYEISDEDNNCRYALITDIGIKPLNLSSILKARLRAVHFLGCSEMELLRAFSSAKRLRVLDLRDCPMQKLPYSICQLRQLRCLNLSGSSGLVNLPEPFGKLENLVYLYLSGCSRLVKLPESFGKLENLVYLDLSGCSRLVKLPESFEKLEDLVHLDLSGCSGLVNLPESFGKLKNLEHLDLSDCSCFEGIPAALRGLTNLQHLNLSHPCCYLVEQRSHLEGLTHVWGKLTKLQYLNLSMCLNPILCYLSEEKSLEYIECISRLSNLERLDLSHNIFLCDLPEGLGKLTKLHTLDLSGCIRLKRLNKWVGEMNSLKFLVTRNCWGLENYQFVVRADDGGHSSNLVQLEGVNPKGLEISCLENVKSIEEARKIRLIDKRKLERLTLAWTVGSRRSVEESDLLGELEPPHNLQCLELHGYNDTCLPAWTLSLSSHLPNLVDVDASDLIGGDRAAAFLRHLKMSLVSACDQVMSSLGKRGGVGGHGVESSSACSTSATVAKQSLQSLCFSQCDSMTSLPESLGDLNSLQELQIVCCKQLQSLPDSMQRLTSLQSVHFSDCESITALPEWFGGLTSLQKLAIHKCHAVKSLPRSIRKLTNLTDLRIWDSPELKNWCESEEGKNRLAHIRPKYEEHVYGKRLSQIQRSVSILSD